MTLFETLINAIDLQRFAFAVATVIVVGGGLSVLALLARSLLRKSTASVHVVIGRVTVACVLLLPAGLFITPALPLVELHSVEQVAAEPTPPGRTVANRNEEASHSHDEQDANDEPAALNRYDSSLAPSREADRTTVAKQVSAKRSRMSAALALVVWAFVACALILRLLLSHLAVSRLLSRSSRDLNPRLSIAVKETLGRNGRPIQVDVRQSPEVRAPVCIGVFRTALLLPTDITDLSDDELRCCVEHEYTHALRRDVLWSTLTEVLVCVHWPNPLMWIFRRVFKEDVESACDDRVLAQGGDCAMYAEMLLGMARRINNRPRHPVAAISMADHVGFQQRLDRIIDTKRDRHAASRLTALLVAFAGIACTLCLLAVRPGFVHAAHSTDGTQPDATRSTDGSTISTEGPIRFGRRDFVAGHVTITSVDWVSEADVASITNREQPDAWLALDPMSALRLADAFKSKRPRERPRLYSIGLTRNVLAKLERAQLDATVSRQPYGIGYRCVESLVRLRLDLLPETHPPRLTIPARIVTTDQAGYFASKLREGQTLTLDNRLDNSGITLRLRIPQPHEEEHSDWWQLVAAGASGAAEQFGATLEVDAEAESSQGAIDVLGFGPSFDVLSFPVSEELGNEVCAASFVSPNETGDSRFALKTSVQRIADEAARLITADGDESITLAIVCHESLKPNPESILPTLVQALRESK